MIIVTLSLISYNGYIESYNYERGDLDTMIRFICGASILILYLIVFIPVLIVEWIIGKIKPGAGDIRSLRMVQAAFKAIIWTTGVDVTVIGEENVPQDQAVLYIANHRSYFDILLTYSRCKRLTGYVAKKEMEKIPLLSNWMKRLHCLFLDRENIKEGLKSILKGIELLKSGISICIFPEGTRNKNKSDLDMLPFHEGSFKMAQKSGCPIVPIAMNNTAEIFENHIPKFKPCKVVIEYCKPIYVSELSKEDQKHIGSYTQAVILETLKKNQSLVEGKK